MWLVGWVSGVGGAPCLSGGGGDVCGCVGIGWESMGWGGSGGGVIEGMGVGDEWGGVSAGGRMAGAGRGGWVHHLPLPSWGSHCSSGHAVLIAGSSTVSGSSQVLANVTVTTTSCSIGDYSCVDTYHFCLGGYTMLCAPGATQDAHHMPAYLPARLCSHRPMAAPAYRVRAAVRCRNRLQNSAFGRITLHLALDWWRPTTLQPTCPHPGVHPQAHH